MQSSSIVSIRLVVSLKLQQRQVVAIITNKKFVHNEWRCEWIKMLIVSIPHLMSRRCHPVQGRRSQCVARMPDDSVFLVAFGW
jgi:hypothetical protein